MGTPTGTDPILFERIDGKWHQRYGSKTDEFWPYGNTVCCLRPVYVPTATYMSVEPVAPPPPVVDCCDTPGVAKPVELPPYSGEHTTCRKCGSRAVETKFSCRATEPHGIAPSRGYPPEWLARRCVVCRATWDEATVPPDAKPGPLEVVDLARVTVKPGDTLLVRPTREAGFLDTGTARDLKEFLEDRFPGVRAMVLAGVAVDVSVIEGGVDG